MPTTWLTGREKVVAAAGQPKAGSEGAMVALPRYVTDGFHLYEIEGTIRNYGLTGGWFMTVQNCLTGQIREVGPLELALCRPVRPA